MHSTCDIYTRCTLFSQLILIAKNRMSYIWDAYATCSARLLKAHIMVHIILQTEQRTLGLTDVTLLASSPHWPLQC